MEEDYWSIDAILAESQKFDCVFQLEVPNLGYIDGGEERNIASQTKMQLPYWLASPLWQGGYVEPKMHQAFATRVIKALNADPRSVKLAALVGGGGSWYGLGKKLSEMLEGPLSAELADTLQKAFRGRLGDLVDQAQHFGSLNAVGGGGTSQAGEFREGLESTERAIFLLAQSSTRQTKAWSKSSDKR